MSSNTSIDTNMSNKKNLQFLNGGKLQEVLIGDDKIYELNRTLRWETTDERAAECGWTEDNGKWFYEMKGSRGYGSCVCEGWRNADGTVEPPSFDTHVFLNSVPTKTPTNCWLKFTCTITCNKVKVRQRTCYMNIKYYKVTVKEKEIGFYSFSIKDRVNSTEVHTYTEDYMENYDNERTTEKLLKILKKENTK